MSKLKIEDLNTLIEGIKTHKDEIFISEEDISKKRITLIDSFKDSPELLMKLLNETSKHYKPIKEVKKILGVKCKDSIIKFLIENLDF